MSDSEPTTPTASLTDQQKLEFIGAHHRSFFAPGITLTVLGSVILAITIALKLPNTYATSLALFAALLTVAGIGLLALRSKIKDCAGLDEITSFVYDQGLSPTDVESAKIDEVYQCAKLAIEGSSPVSKTFPRSNPSQPSILDCMRGDCP